jgi:hypothetical protein
VNCAVQVSDWTETLPGLVDTFPVRFLPLTVQVTVPLLPTFAPSGLGIVFQILIRLPIITLDLSRNNLGVTHQKRHYLAQMTCAKRKGYLLTGALLKVAKMLHRKL